MSLAKTYRVVGSHWRIYYQLTTVSTQKHSRQSGHEVPNESELKSEYF